MTSFFTSFGKPGAAAMVAGLLFSSSAQAQATRTWVSGAGNDADPCSRSAPCQTFDGAIAKTAAGGEINCLDAGGWGPVTITKSITIDCTQFPGGILNAGTYGITVNAGPADNVTIRGLEIAGGIGPSRGIAGVRFLTGASLTLQKMVIRNNTRVINATGIVFQPSGVSRLVVEDVAILNNDLEGGIGIFVGPTGTDGVARVSLDRVSIHNSGGVGIKFDGNSGSNIGGTLVSITNSHLSGNAIGIDAFSNTALLSIQVIGTAISSSSAAALSATGDATVIYAGGNSLTGNGTAVVKTSGGRVFSYMDNWTRGNIAPSSFTAPPVAKN